MSCLFVHDFRSYRVKDDVYTTNLSYTILRERYVNVFGNVNILNRSGKMTLSKDKKRLVKASGDFVNFIGEIGIFTPSSFFRDYYRIKKIVVRHVAEAEYTIIRLDSFLGLIAAQYCRKHNKKYLIEVVGCVWDSFWNKGLLGKMVALPLYNKMKKAIRNAPYVVYVTHDFLQKRYPTNGQNTNISNVFLKPLEESTLIQRLYKIENIDSEHIYEIVTIASVEVRYKGQETVIRALAYLKKNGQKNFRYHLIGGGDDSFLRRLTNDLKVSDQVIFHGSLNHEEVMDFLDDADIYIQPSKQEGLPRSLIEGMSRGLLCYGTNIAGIPELLSPEMLISKKKNNYIELAEKLSRIDKDLCKDQAKKNFEKAKKYEESILDEKRKCFFKTFKEQIKYE